MGKRVLSDVLIGAVLALGSQILQYGAYLILILAGFSMPYESAPPDPGSRPDWVTQINLMFLVAGAPVLVAAFAAAWILKTRGIGDGVRQGLVWAAVAAVWQLVVGVANGTTAVLAVPGVWAYFAAVAVGPMIAGWLRQRPAPDVTTSGTKVAHRIDP